MNTELRVFYEEYKRKSAAYQFVLASVQFDQMTIIPSSGLLYSHKMYSILEREYLTYAFSPENTEKLRELRIITTDESLREELTLRLRNHREINVAPKSVYRDFRKSEIQVRQYWERAKRTNDFSLIEPCLQSLVENRKSILRYVEHDGSNYDFLLDQCQMNLNKEKYDLFFSKVKERLIPLLQQIRKYGRAIDTELLRKTYSVEKQKKFVAALKEVLQINSETCLIVEGTTHPFCLSLSCKDIRFTTRYVADNIMSAILLTAHEYGHALYHLQINDEFVNTSFSSEIGLAMQESQARFMENHIVRNPHFWNILYLKLQQLFPEHLERTTIDGFTDMIQATTPNLIRNNADELTYPLHILIRYELELEMFDGNISFDSLNKLWRNKYEEYLGIRPNTLEEGILQDIHWRNAYFGYFPTYAIGSAFAAQFYQQLEKDIDVRSALQNNNFEKITHWLRENIHQYGASKTYDEILIGATNESFNPQYYINYLEDKYTKLYSL